jgi:predicted amidohydrolase
VSTLRVAVAQLAATEDPAANTAAATRLVAEAAEAGARLLLLPEYTLAWAPRLHTAMATGHEAFAEALAAAAATHRIWVIAGTLRPHGERMRNIAIAVAPDGQVRGSYDKVHLFDAFGVRESDALDAGAPGTGVFVEIDGWRVGIATCYDLRFPESFRILADGGADVLAVGAAWAAGSGKADQLEVLARARALENTSYLLLASQCGQGRTGHSAVVGPLGELMDTAGDEPVLLVADLDRDRLTEVRTTVPSLRHRRYAVVPRQD